MRTLSVTVPQTFWVRLYIKSDKAIGQPDHNSFFGAGVDPDYSKGKFVEVSEQFNCVLLNASDSLNPTGTTCGANTALTANEWHCMAAQFDGATGNVQVFSGTTKIIDAAAWTPAKQAFTTFSFGYFAYNANSATVWYDNVVVSASPLSCPLRAAGAAQTAGAAARPVAAAAVYFAISRPMRGTAASTCFLPVGRSFS